LDQAQYKSVQGFRACNENSCLGSDDWRLDSPSTGDEVSMTLSKEVPSKEDLNSNNAKPGVIKGGQILNDIMIYKGHHTFGTGLDHASIGPSRGYKPSTSLIALFNKTGMGRCNPNSLSRSTTPLKQPTAH
jgi:hypothetical protein